MTWHQWQTTTEHQTAVRYEPYYISKENLFFYLSPLAPPAKKTKKLNAKYEALLANIEYRNRIPNTKYRLI